MRLSRALAASLALHVLLLALPWQRDAAVRAVAPPLHVRLRFPRPPAARTEGAQRMDRESLPAPGKVQEAPVPLDPNAGGAARWHETARAVLDELRAPAATSLRPLPGNPPGAGHAVPPRTPGLAEAFRPAPRPRRLCGREATLDLGVRRVTLPVLAPCPDRRAEREDDAPP